MTKLNRHRDRGIGISVDTLIFGVDTSGEVVVVSVDSSGYINTSLGAGGSVIAKISGETITVAGGVSVSGNIVTINSGLYVTTVISASFSLESGSVAIPDVLGIASGVVSILSGTVTNASGGQVIGKVIIESGIVRISGDTVVTSVSGNIVTTNISGQVLEIYGEPGLSGILNRVTTFNYADRSYALDVSIRGLGDTEVVDALPVAYFAPFALEGSVNPGTIINTRRSIDLDNNTLMVYVDGGLFCGKISGLIINKGWISGLEVTIPPATLSGLFVNTGGSSQVSGTVSVSGGVIVSGTVNTSVSGNVVSVASGLIPKSGIEIIWRTPIISGSIIVSGNVGTSVSGNLVSIQSGLEIIWRTPIISGSIIVSGNVGTTVSGNIVSVASGMFFASGIGVLASISPVSGQEIIWRGVTVSGSVSLISGAYLASGVWIANPSTATVQSGVYLASGLSTIASIRSGIYIASGMYVTAALTTGNAVSGAIITVRNIGGTLISGNSTSGIMNVATQMPPYAGFATAITNPPTNQVMYLGGSAVSSGRGYLLSPGASISLPIDNLNRVWAVALKSGEVLSWVGVNF